MKLHRFLGVIIFAPGVAFAIANASAPSVDSQSASTAVAAVGLSGLVGSGVALKPSRLTYVLAFVWSAFSVVFELTQAQAHYDHGANGRAAISIGLGVVRAAGVLLSARLLRS